jgi:hypothetical protein
MRYFGFLSVPAAGKLAWPSLTSEKLGCFPPEPVVFETGGREPINGRQKLAHDVCRLSFV